MQRSSDPPSLAGLPTPSLRIHRYHPLPLKVTRSATESSFLQLCYSEVPRTHDTNCAAAPHEHAPWPDILLDEGILHRGRKKTDRSSQRGALECR